MRQIYKVRDLLIFLFSQGTLYDHPEYDGARVASRRSEVLENENRRGPRTVEYLSTIAVLALTGKETSYLRKYLALEESWTASTDFKI